jgi:hypothetical protein
LESTSSPIEVVAGRTLALALALLPACLATPSDPVDEEVVVDLGCPSAGSLTDEFEEEKSEVWEEFGIDDCELRVAGRLEVDSAASCGLATVGCYDMTDRWIEVDAVVSGPGLVFAIHLDDFGDDLIVRVNRDGDLAMAHVDPAGKTTTLTALPFDPEVHQVWRILHSATENRVTFETARRGTGSWARLAELFLDGVSVRQVQVRLGASGSDGMVAFDSLRGVDL